MRSAAILWILAWLAFLPIASLARESYLIDGVPLPPDASPTSDGPWAGAWVGAWGGQLKHILIIESVAADGSATVIYAYGDLPFMRIQRGWSRLAATIDGQALRITGSAFTATYRLSDMDHARATYTRGPVANEAVMTRVPLASLAQADAQVPWTRGRSVMLPTNLTEDGKPVRLEVVMFSPPGPGPFPLAIVNHGSTGLGTDPALFTATFIDLGIADFLNAHGWIVAFPQRRGRGRSDGLYDEGFGPDRAKGYTCDVDRSLAGAERALADVEAAVTAIRLLPNVTPGPLLMAGISRGGALSVAFAGTHPADVVGVINFVGGWVGSGCPTAEAINGFLLQRGAAFPNNMLWLYGNNDPYYPVEHSRGNFARYLRAGGKGSFKVFDVLGNQGHNVAYVTSI